jgi:hypothetical protein
VPELIHGAGLRWDLPYLCILEKPDELHPAIPQRRGTETVVESLAHPDRAGTAPSPRFKLPHPKPIFERGAVETSMSASRSSTDASDVGESAHVEYG